jgi:hypothetical protein
MAAMTSDLAAFKAALAKGSGRAMILLREAKGAGFTAALLEACWINPAYDPQCEADRAPWLARLVEASGELEDMFDRILAGVEGWGDCDEEIHFPLRVLCHLAAAHPALDRSRLMAVLDAQDEDDRLLLADQFIQLNGYPAFREALSRIGPEWDEDGWMAEDWLKVLREREGPEIEAVLAADAATDALVAKALAGRPEMPPSPPRALEPIESLRETLRVGNSRWGPLSRPRPEAELRLLAQDLAECDEGGRALPYLRFFARQPWPGDPKTLLRWRSDGDQRVRFFARRALEQVDHWAVRALALKALAALEPWSVGLLKSNYRPGDYPLIAAVIESDMTPFQAHDLIMDVLDIRGQLTPDERRDALLKAYDKTPCSFCREDVVAALRNDGDLPRWMAEECRYDADPETAALAGS